MSCHDVGRALNSVVRKSISLMEKGEISKAAAREIIYTCGKSVNWCDGNTYEAVDYIIRCTCGKCMKLVPAGEKLYSVWHLSNAVPDRYHISSLFHLASPGLCEECFDEVIGRQCKDADADAREKAYMEEQYGKKSCESTGAYEETNNGYRWID